ncbi:MAG: response regulator transcription factor [Actinobacteria bacterium]|nr:response regulator transcription factor [Actinomycetota bacterium]
MKRILIIEDEKTLAEALEYTLTKEGYDVKVAFDGAAGLRAFESGGADLVLLDLMLPEIDGLEVCRRIRSNSSVSILIVTAKDSDIDEILGLELGADDYVTKPFNTRMLIARIKALLRRSEARTAGESGQIEWGDLTVDCDRYECYLKGRTINLTPLEYRLLWTFMKHPGKAMSREFLLNAAWEGDFYGSPKTLDVHIRHLREKIEDDPADPKYIETVRGVGYRLGKPD